jgi:hypothetical protein
MIAVLDRDKLAVFNAICLERLAFAAIGLLRRNE